MMLPRKASDNLVRSYLFEVVNFLFPVKPQVEQGRFERLLAACVKNRFRF